MRITSSDFSFRLCAFSVLSARICQASSRLGTTSAVIDFAPRRRIAASRWPPFGVQKPFSGRGDGDDRVEEEARLVDDVGEALVVHVGDVALERRAARRCPAAAPRAAADSCRADRGRRRAPRRPPSRSFPSGLFRNPTSCDRHSRGSQAARAGGRLARALLRRGALEAALRLFHRYCGVCAPTVRRRMRRRWPW